MEQIIKNKKFQTLSLVVAYVVVMMVVMVNPSSYKMGALILTIASLLLIEIDSSGQKKFIEQLVVVAMMLLNATLPGACAVHMTLVMLVNLMSCHMRSKGEIPMKAYGYMAIGQVVLFALCWYYADILVNIHPFAGLLLVLMMFFYKMFRLELSD